MIRRLVNFGSPCSGSWSLPASHTGAVGGPCQPEDSEQDHDLDTELPCGFASLTHKLTWELTSCYLVIQPSDILIPFITPETQCCPWPVQSLPVTVSLTTQSYSTSFLFSPSNLFPGTKVCVSIMLSRFSHATVCISLPHALQKTLQVAMWL